jgi:hypothetical protein
MAPLFLCGVPPFTELGAEPPDEVLVGSCVAEVKVERGESSLIHVLLLLDATSLKFRQ